MNTRDTEQAEVLRRERDYYKMRFEVTVPLLERTQLLPILNEEWRMYHTIPEDALEVPA